MKTTNRYDGTVQEVDPKLATIEQCVIAFLQENPGPQSQSAVKVALQLNNRFGRDNVWNVLDSMVGRRIITRLATTRLNQYVIELTAEFRPPRPEDEFRQDAQAVR